MECTQCGYDFPSRSNAFNEDTTLSEIHTDHYCSCNEDCNEDKDEHCCYVEDCEVSMNPLDMIVESEVG
tara:strand:- start:2 stop:208 length:207 start_codon:yes stop_codon:yes gene_type:complete